MNIFTATSDQDMRANLRDSWQRADAECREQGATWYPSANNLINALADAAAMSPVDVAGIMAVLSPRSSWGTNVRNTAAILVEAGHITAQNAAAILALHGYGTSDTDADQARLNDGPRGLGTSIAKARRIAEEESAAAYVVSGQKVLSFFHNLIDPAHSDDVTVDAWAAGVVMGRRLNNAEMTGLTAKQYARIGDQYRIVAAELGIVPSELQAATWCEIRGRAR